MEWGCLHHQLPFQTSLEDHLLLLLDVTGYDGSVCVCRPTIEHEKTLVPDSSRT